MTQKDKEILLKDLCARLPYGVRCSFGVDDAVYEITGINPTCYGASEIQATHIKSGINGNFTLNNCKPYLFPLSSMTEEQKEELKHEISKQTEILIERMKNDDCGIDCGKYHFHSILELEWLLKNQFDFRGLIPKGSALDATGLNIY